MTKISKSELAKELQASPGTITHQIARGVLHVLLDGSLDREASLRAIMGTSGHGGGWTGGSRGKKSLGERAAGLLKPKQTTTETPVELPPSFAYGMAFLAERLRDPERVETSTNVVAEAVIGITPEQARLAVLLCVYLANGWLSEFLPLTSKKYERQFKRELEMWSAKHIPWDKSDKKAMRAEAKE